jgi:hypothetical protein
VSRSKLFISYSHQDDDWLERLKLHLAQLERRGIVHVWSDTQIRVGDRWEVEIEGALTESRAAVLMITPAFLASPYIWEHEVPRILKHAAAGMLVFPLITRPCAWRIAPELAQRQARPVNGRALSLGTEANVDNELADFVYELASILGQLPGSVASQELDKTSRRTGSRTNVQAPESRPYSPEGDPSSFLCVGRPWTGVYSPTGRAMRLVIGTLDESQHFLGTIEYPDDGTITEIQGKVVSLSTITNDPSVAKLIPSDRMIDCAITFRETRMVRTGSQPFSLEGEYHALITGQRLSGAWRGKGTKSLPFDLVFGT